MANAAPTRCGGQACAESAENWGESATTVAPQKMKMANSAAGGRKRQNRANKVAHINEPVSAPKATFALPIVRDTIPPVRLPTAPMPIITKAQPDKPSLGKCSGNRVWVNSAGTIVQKAYSSHMWPKYPKAAARNWGTLKADNTESGLPLTRLVGDVLRVLGR